MAAVLAQSHYTFGARAGVRDNLFFLDEQTIIFPCGNNCVRFNIPLKCQRFIPGTERSQGMQALAISTNRRYLAVSERGEKATITVFDLQHEQSRKRKVLTAGEKQVDEFVCMAFSPDSKYLIGQGGGPDWTLFLWMWQKQKVMATVKTSTNGAINQVSFNPQNNSQICVSGNRVFKLFRYAGETLKQTNTFKTDSQNFLCHTWMPVEQVIAGTETGQVMMFESGRLRWDVNVQPVQSVQEAERPLEKESNETLSTASLLPRVTAIMGYSKGFICSAGPGTVCLFEKTEEKDQYKKIKDIKIPPEPFGNEPSSATQQEISTMCISPLEETLAVSTDRGQLYSIALSLADLSRGDCIEFEYLSHSFHSGIITGLSTCIRKPLIATCSLDRSVRIWNFDTHVLEMYKEFQEEAYSIALHPSGLFILVGFSNKLCLMNLLIDDIRTFKEFIVRGCHECVFSHGGHLFAAVSGNVINVYSTTTFEDILNLKGHNKKVRAISFSADDTRLVSCGMDGAVYEWNTLSGKRESESVLKSCSYTGVTISPDAKTFFTVGTDFTLKEIQDCQILKEIPAGDVVYTTVAMSHSGRALFVGTSIGTLRVIKYPLPIQKDWLEYEAHASPVTKMAITFDDQFLLTASEDGCLIIWKIIDKEGRGLKKERELNYSEEILITKSDLDDKNKIMKELKIRVDELQKENKYQLSLREITYKQKINELSETFIQHINSLNAEKEVMKKERLKQEEAHSKTLSEIMEKHVKELKDLESANNQKLMLEYKKFQELQLKLQSVQQDYEQQLHSITESKTRTLEEMTQLYEAKLQEQTLMLTQCKDESRQHIQEFEEFIKQLEEDGDIEIQDIRMKYEQNFREEKMANSRLKVELDTTKKSFHTMQKDIENRNLEIQKLKQEMQKLQAVIKSLEKDIMALKNGLQQKDLIIQDKEKTIYDLRQKNDTLKNRVAVMEFKDEYAKEQIEPKEKKIKELTEQMQEMEGELDQFQRENTQLELKIEELDLKLKTKDKEMRKEMQKVQDTKALVRRFKADLHKCVGFIQEPKKLNDSVRELYKCYVQQSDGAQTVDSDQREKCRQREHFEQIITTLKKQLTRDSNVHQANNVKLMKENVTLMKEINDLRQELRTVRMQLHTYESQSTLTKRSKTKISTNSRAASAGTDGSTTRLNFEKEIQLQQLEIQRLQQEIDGQIPSSSTKLPPITT